MNASPQSPLPTLMLLPGLMCDAAVWEPQVQALSGQANCLVPDWGHLASLTAMAEQVLATAPTQQFAMAGHSMGGRVAFEVMRLAPERVTRLALLDTGFHPVGAGVDGAAETAKRMALLALARASGMRAMAQQWAKGMVHPARLDTPLFESILDMVARSTPAKFEAQIQALLARRDATLSMAAITCPTLVLCGRDDAWSPPVQHERIHAAIAGSELVVIEVCGHMSTMERPEAVNASFASWLQG
jgi:pimeloyl-ACP methyl ester carboxylesterase